MRLPELHPPDRAARPPRLKGRYEIVRLLGKGAQARVYLAWDVRLRHWRAIKVLAPNLLDDPHVRERFELEAQVMARLSHPHLQRVIDIDADGRHPYMVMELARGGSVADWMRRNGRPLAPRLAVRVARQCAAGLAHAHEAGIVHRDVKPHNVLIREDGAVVLTDFGIAQLTDAGSLTATGAVMGTFAFMAPEQRVDAKSVDARADVYSLGATLFTMLTGTIAGELFFAESRDELLEAVPDPLRPLILAACRYERERRFQGMADFEEALDRRLGRLPPDPPCPPLADALLALPEAPEDPLAPDAGVEELARALESSEDAETTYVLERPPRPPAPRESPATLEGPRASPRGLGYRMPPRDPPPPPAPRPEPEPTEPSTLGRVPLAPRVLASLPPIEAAAERARAWLVSGTIAVAAAVFVLGVLAASLGTKIGASRAVDAAGDALLARVSVHQAMIGELAELGADQRALHDLWFAMEDARGAARIEAAAAFAARAAEEAERVEAHGLLRTQASRLAAAREDWVEARVHLEAVRRSRLARVTGELGL